jgi:glyoxylase-like metal-dependent hydrolase (beta-lactamase superfamily II)
MLVGACLAFAQGQQPAPIPAKIEKIANDFYVLRGDGGNTSVYITDEGVVLVDVKFERNFEDIQAKVKSLTDKPIKYIFNTHAHGDHTGGNQKFLVGGTQIIAHRDARKAMIEGKLPGPPQITYTDEISLNLGGKEVIGRYFGPGHTDGDTWVYFAALKVLAAGDSFNTGNGQGQTGSITFGLFIAPGGSLIEITNTIDKALKEDFDVVVPGHGPIAKRADLVKWREEIELLQNRLAVMIREGRSKDEVTKMLVDEFGWDPKGRPIGTVDSLLAQIKR